MSGMHEPRPQSFPRSAQDLRSTKPVPLLLHAHPHRPPTLPRLRFEPSRTSFTRGSRPLPPDCRPARSALLAVDVRNGPPHAPPNAPPQRTRTRHPPPPQSQQRRHLPPDSDTVSIWRRSNTSSPTGIISQYGSLTPRHARGGYTRRPHRPSPWDHLSRAHSLSPRPHSTQHLPTRPQRPGLVKH